MVWNAFMENEEVQTLTNTSIPKEIDHKNSQTWSKMGIELWKMKKYFESMQCFEKALVIDQDNYDALIYKSRILFSQKKIRESVVCLDKILKKHPNAIEVLHLKGTRNAAWLGNVRVAIECFEKVLKNKPDHSMSAYWLTQVLSDYGKFEEALDVANKLLKIKPDSDPLNYCKIHILGNLERFEEQIFACDLWLENEPTAKAIMHTKANALANLKKFKEAVIWYDNAWRLHKNFYGLENKRRALEAIKTGKVSDLPFTYHCDGKKFNFSILYKSWDEKTKVWKKRREEMGNNQ